VLLALGGCASAPKTEVVTGGRADAELARFADAADAAEAQERCIVERESRIALLEQEAGSAKKSLL
jgi:hypothetical protein